MFTEDVAKVKEMIKEEIDKARAELKSYFDAQIEKLKSDITPKKVVEKEVKRNEL